MSEATQAENLLRALPQFTATDAYHRHWVRPYVITDGVKYLAEGAGAFWLLDAVFSHQVEPKVKRREFQVWTLTVNQADRTAVLVMTDGNSKRPLVTQEIEATDFPLPTMELWLEGNVLILPSEH